MSGQVTNAAAGPPGGRREARISEAQRTRLVQLFIVLLAGLTVRIAFVQSPGYRDDMVIFYGWLRSIENLPPAQVYAHIPGLNYPPVYVVLAELSALILRFFVHGPPSDATLNVAVKLPPIVFDLLGSALAYCIVRRAAGHRFALCSAAFMAFNPALIYDSAYWVRTTRSPRCSRCWRSRRWARATWWRRG